MSDLHLFWKGLSLVYENMPGTESLRSYAMDQCVEKLIGDLSRHEVENPKIYSTVASILSSPRDSSNGMEILMEWLIAGILDYHQNTFHDYIRAELEKMDNEQRERFCRNVLHEIEFGCSHENRIVLPHAVGQLASQSNLFYLLGSSLATHIVVHAKRQDVRAAVIVGLLEYGKEYGEEIFKEIRTESQRIRGADDWIGLISSAAILRDDDGVAGHALIEITDDKRELMAVISSLTKMFCKDARVDFVEKIAKAAQKTHGPRSLIKGTWRKMASSDVAFGSVRELGKRLESRLDEDMNESLILDDDAFYTIFKSSGTLSLF